MSDSDDIRFERVNFTDLLDGVIHDKVLLPDFQRGFKWDVNKQKALVCSVLSRFPLGTLLILKGEKGTFGSKSIGSTKNYIKVDNETAKDEMSFLLDGQQRLTVLANAFSPVILGKEDKYSGLNNVFFLRIPKWKSVYDEFNKVRDKGIKEKNEFFETNDIFHLSNLSFPSDYIEKYPKFATDKIADDVLTEGYLKRKHSIDYLYKKWAESTNTLFDYIPKDCKEDEKAYFVPLFLLSPNKEGKKTEKEEKTELLRNVFFDQLGDAIAVEIKTYIELNKNDDDKINGIIDDLYSDSTIKELAAQMRTTINNWKKENCVEHQKYDDDLKNKIKERVKKWRDSFKKYLCTSCLKGMTINKIELSSNQSDRAISIFTNMNQTSVVLDEFDLLVARVAICMEGKNYVEYLKECFDKDNDFKIDEVLKDKPEIIESFKKNIILSDANGSDNTKENTKSKKTIIEFFNIFDTNDNELSSLIKQTILKLLHLYAKRKDFNYCELPKEFCSTNKTRLLDPNEMKNITPKICLAIKRALIFFLSRCGIRSLSDINYQQHMFLVSAFFLNDAWYNNNDVHRKLELWYWTSVFSGAYNADQNKHTIEDISGIYSILMCKVSDKEENNKDGEKTEKQSLAEKEAREWLVNRGKECFNNDASSREFLLMKKESGYPKDNYRDFVCQFYLSKRYQKLFTEGEKTDDFFIDVFTSELEAHHIIPLASVKTYGESEKNFRDKKDSYLNSPLNFVYITKTENNYISDKSYNEYTKEIKKEDNLTVLSDIGLSIAKCDVSKEEENKVILWNRAEHIKGELNKIFKDVFKEKIVCKEIKNEKLG